MGLIHKLFEREEEKLSNAESREKYTNQFEEDGEGVARPGKGGCEKRGVRPLGGEYI